MENMMDILKVIEQRKQEAKKVKESGKLDGIYKKESKDDLVKVSFESKHEGVLGFNFK